MSLNPPGLNAPVEPGTIDRLIASSGEALAVSAACAENGQHELASLWARFAEYLVASEAYLDTGLGLI